MEKLYKGVLPDKFTVISSPVGALTLAGRDDKLTHLLFGEKAIPGAKRESCPLFIKAQRQLEEYFKGKRREFTIPAAPLGTEFQLKVWQALLQIPYGETRSYGEIAIAAGNPKACRAVGMANNRNPISIIVPCHRVIGRDGKLTGYGGGMENKELLLKLEGFLR